MASPPALPMKWSTWSGQGSVGGHLQARQNRHLALVANVDYKKPLQTRVFVASGAKRPHRFNLTTRTWENAKALAQIGGYAVDVELTPGGAALLKW